MSSDNEFLLSAKAFVRILLKILADVGTYFFNLGNGNYF